MATAWFGLRRSDGTEGNLARVLSKEEEALMSPFASTRCCPLDDRLCARLRALRSLTPYEHIRKLWTTQPINSS